MPEDNLTAETIGILPPDMPLPRFARSEAKLGMSHQDWLNTFLDRLVKYEAQTIAQGKQPVMRQFCWQEFRGRDPSRAQSVGATLKAILGMEMGRGKRNLDIAPQCLTELGAAALLEVFYPEPHLCTCVYRLDNSTEKIVEY